jgi:hypothetical protein
MNVITSAMTNHPRSLQKHIGPSEIGIECDKRIIYKLAQVEEPPRGPAWKPAVGTAVHAQLEQWFSQANTAPTRWVVEHRVQVGFVGGTPITGSCDLFDVTTGTIIDHKVVGPRQLLNYRRDGPSSQYRIQAHLYGLGYMNDGGWGQPNTVAIAFLPRDGELSKTFFWSEPWNPSIALDALNRLERLNQLRLLLGTEAAVNSSPGCTSPWCPWCKTTPQRAAGQSLFAAT